MIADFMVCRFGAMMAKYLDLYWELEMDLYWDYMLAYGSNSKSQKAEMVAYLLVYYLSDLLTK